MKVYLIEFWKRYEETVILGIASSQEKAKELLLPNLEWKSDLAEPTTLYAVKKPDKEEFFIVEIEVDVLTQGYLRKWA
jgi:hypothetical protein